MVDEIMLQQPYTIPAPLAEWWAEHPGPKARLPKHLKTLVDRLDIPGFNTQPEKIFALRNGIYIRPVCAVCGGKVKFAGRFLRTCSIQCAGKDPARLAAIEKTNLTRYGSTSSASNPEVIARRKRTNKERYGVINSSQSPLIIAKTRATNIGRYGVPCTLNTAENTERKKATWLTNYGVENPGQAAGPRAKTQATRHAAKTAQKKDRLLELEALGFSALFTEWEDSSTQYPWRHDVCGTEFLHHFIGDVVPRCPMCHPRNTSAEERVVQDLLTSLGVSFTTGDRTIIKPLELDIYIKNQKLAIEVNGAYWHHDGGTLRPLLEKTRLAEEAGVELLHFWAHEINENLPAVTNIIMAKLGLHRRRYARLLEIKTLHSSEAAKFLRDHHLAGHARAKIYLGLVEGDQLVAVASFAPNRFQKDSTWELVRFASEGSVVGGLSRLVKTFQRQVGAALVSFADARYSTGAAYKKVGFAALGLTKPNYFYIKGSQRLYRQQAMKHKLPTLLEIFDQSLSEYQNMLNNGWLRCSDCGSYKFILPPIEIT